MKKDSSLIALQLNLYPKAALRTEESGRWGDVAVMGRKRSGAERGNMTYVFFGGGRGRGGGGAGGGRNYNMIPKFMFTVA